MLTKFSTIYDTKGIDSKIIRNVGWTLVIPLVILTICYTFTALFSKPGERRSIMYAYNLYMVTNILLLCFIACPVIILTLRLPILEEIIKTS